MACPVLSIGGTLQQVGQEFLPGEVEALGFHAGAKLSALGRRGGQTSQIEGGPSQQDLGGSTPRRLQSCFGEFGSDERIDVVTGIL